MLLHYPHHATWLRSVHSPGCCCIPTGHHLPLMVYSHIMRQLLACRRPAYTPIMGDCSSFRLVSPSGTHHTGSRRLNRSYFPASHARHCKSTSTSPATHVWQLAEPGLAKVPSAQGVHSVDPLELVFPAGQIEQPMVPQTSSSQNPNHVAPIVPG